MTRKTLNNVWWCEFVNEGLARIGEKKALFTKDTGLAVGDLCYVDKYGLLQRERRDRPTEYTQRITDHAGVWSDGVGVVGELKNPNDQI